jgi:ketosteroid isomerase-like protein
VAGDKTTLIRRIFERWNSGEGREPRADELHPDIEVHSRVAQVMGGGPYRGHDGVRQWVSDLDDAFGEFQLNIDDAQEIGDRLLLFGSIDIRGRAGQTQLHEPMAWVFEFEDGLIRRMRTFRSYDEGRAAAGLDA